MLRGVRRLAGRLASFLRKRHGGAGTAAVATSLFGDAVLQATYGAAPGGNILVLLCFRGGVDGMGLVVPHGDPAYAAARPTMRSRPAACWSRTRCSACTRRWLH